MATTAGPARYLLDTHALLWALAGDERLPSGLSAHIARRPEHFAVSDVSVWEVAVKAGLGKLSVPAEFPDVLDSTAHSACAITRDDVWATRALPHHHRDPFDRLLIAQARRLDLSLITSDPRIGAYDVPVHWET